MECTVKIEKNGCKVKNRKKDGWMVKNREKGWGVQ